MPNGVKIYDIGTGKLLGAGQRPTFIDVRRAKRVAPSPQPVGEEIPTTTIPWGTEQRTWDIPLPLPPTVGEQFKKAGAEILGVLGKPFQYFEEYVAKPFAAGVTAPFWEPEGKTEAGPSLEEFKGLFKPESLYREAYAEWKAPKYLKGTLELLPWFALPPVAKIAGTLGKLGKVGQLAAKGLAPAVQAEATMGRVISVPLRAAGKVIKRLDIVKDIKFAGSKPVEDIIAYDVAMHPERLRAYPTIGKPFITNAQRETARINKESEELYRKIDVILREDALVRDNEVPTIMSLLTRLGDNEASLFRLKEMAIPGTKVTHELVSAPFIKATPEARKLGLVFEIAGKEYFGLDDVLRNPSLFPIKGVPGWTKKKWAEQLDEIYRGAEGFRLENIKRELTAPARNTERYTHSVVSASRDPKTGRVLREIEPYPGGFKTTPGAFKPAEFKYQAEGIKAGYKYERPIKSATIHVSEYYNAASRERVIGMLDDLFIDPMQKMNKEIANQMKHYIKMVKVLGGGMVTSVTKAGIKTRTQYPGVSGVINRIIRGEVPAKGTIDAINRVSPEIGGRLREALNISVPEVDNIIKGLSRDAWDAIKITKERFRATLTETRAKIATKKVEREAMDVDRIAAEIAGLESWIGQEKAVSLVNLIKKTGWYKGEIKTLTLKQYRDITGKDIIQPNILTPDKKHVRWEYALDDIATELGYKSGDDLKNAIEQVSEGMAKLKDLKGDLAIAQSYIPEEIAITGKGMVSAGELTATLKTLGVEEKSALDFLSKMYAEAYKKPTMARKALLRELTKDVKRTVAETKAEAKAFAPQFREARRKAIETAFNEGRLVKMGGYMNKILPDKTDLGITGAQLAQRLNKKFTAEKVNVALKGASKIARMGVTLVAALDTSLIFIQGPLVLGYDIGRWAQFKKSTAFYNMTKQMIKAMWNPKYQDEFMAKEASILAEMGINRSVIRKAVDYLETGDIEALMRKGGKVGGFFGNVFKQTYGRAGAGFGSGSLAARVTMYKQARTAWLKSGHKLEELGELVNKLSGVVSSAELGVSVTGQAVERATLFAPNYTRAYLMVVADLFRTGKTANEVRKAMAGMLAGGLISYVGLCEMIGQEPKLNPAPKSAGGDGAEFGSFRIGNSIIGIPGFWYSAIRMVMNVTAAAEEDPEKLLTLDWREQPFLRWAMGRTSPLVHVADELVSGRDFMGRKLRTEQDWAYKFACHFLTIASQNLITYRPGEEEGKWKRFGAEIFGLRSYPLPEWEKLKDMKDEYAVKDFGKKFEQINQEQKDKLLETHPDYKKFYEEAKDRIVLERGEDIDIQLWSARNYYDAVYRGTVEEAARGLLSGLIDYRLYLETESDLRKFYKGNVAAINYIKAEADPDVAKNLIKYLEKQPLEDKALGEYLEIYRNPSRSGGIIDWNTTEARIKTFLASLDDNTRAYVLRNRNRWIKDLPPTAKMLAEIQAEGRDIVDEYYNQPQGKARTAYRRANPTVDAWLLIMGRVTSPQTAMGAQLALELLRERGLPSSLIPKAMLMLAVSQPAWEFGKRQPQIFSSGWLRR